MALDPAVRIRALQDRLTRQEDVANSRVGVMTDREIMLVELEQLEAHIVRLSTLVGVDAFMAALLEIARLELDPDDLPSRWREQAIRAQGIAREALSGAGVDIAAKSNSRVVG